MQKENLINAAVGQISGSVSDTATNIPLATQAQADTWTDFPVRATCYNAAKPFIEAVEDGDIEVVVIDGKDGQDLLVSERAAEPIGGQQTAKSMDADWQIAATNTGVATQKAIDNVFAFGAYPDSLSVSELEVLADSQQVMEDVADRHNALGRIMESPYVLDIVFDNESAAEILAGSETAINFIVDSQVAMDAVVDSETAMNAIADSQLARDTIGTEGMAFDTIAASNMAIGKYVAGIAELNPSDYADMDAVADSQTAMDAVSDSQAAMDTVVASQVAMDAVADSAIAITIFLASSNLDWTSLTKSQGNNILASANSFTPSWTEVDDGIGDGGWDRSGVEARYGDDMSNDWGAHNDYPDTPSDIATALGFSPQGSNQGQSTIGWIMDLTNITQMDFWYMHQTGHSSRPQEIIINGDTVFNFEDATDWQESNIDLSSYSGDCTVEFGFGSDLDHDDSALWIAFTGIKLTKD